MTDQPQTANEVLEATRNSHSQTATPLDINSTDGMKRTLEFHEAALKNLADFIDGPSKADNGARIAPPAKHKASAHA